MNVSPLNHALQGVIVLPGDKSVSHRALLFAALCESPSTIRHLGSGGDNKSTIACLKKLGVRVEGDGDHITVYPTARFEAPKTPLDCGNSGTTMRLLSGVLAGAGVAAELIGDASLSKRPMRRVTEPLSKLGAEVTTGEGGRPPVRIAPKPLRAAALHTGVISAQVKSALVLAALHADGESTIREPELTRDHTERMMQALGFPLTVDGGEIRVRSLSGRRPQGFSMWVPGDPSSAAFWSVLASLVPGSDVSIIDVCLNPTRIAFVDVLRRMGAHIDVIARGESAGEPWGDLRVRYAEDLRGTVVSGHEAHLAIDELPVLMVAMASAAGRSEIKNAEDLRNKESDRIAAMSAVLSGFGTVHEVQPDGIVIDGVRRAERSTQVARVDAELDHRIALSAAVMALAGPAAVEIAGFEAASVSYGAFLAEAKRLSGGQMERGRAITVAIDGPAGAGKSTVSKRLAERLGYTLVDTGAIYRSLAWKALQRGVDPESGDALAPVASAIDVRFEASPQGQRVVCDGADVTDAIRTPEVSRLASIVSQHREVRAALLEIQRRLAGRGGAVLEGRDIGTVVFPEAQAKFFLDAAPEERARRRMDELAAKQQPAEFEQVLKEIKERDGRDSGRDVAPLRPAADAVMLDSTKLDVADVVSEMERRVRAKELGVMSVLKDLLQKPSIDLAEVAATLDALDEATLVRETQTLGLKEQQSLFEAAKGFRRWTLDDVVPPGTPPGAQVIHQGKNTLPMFSVFQKRFARPEAGSDELWGINAHTFGAFTGPGYFVARNDDGQVLIDYNRVPPKQLQGWPRVKENKGFWGLTYGTMIDTVRGVSRRVSIGHADKRGKDMGCFVLVRLGG